MATTWQTVFREVAKHANAFASGNAATVSGLYLTSPLTTSQVSDPYFNYDFIKDKCIDVHGRLALEICNVLGHQWRSRFAAVTGGLSSGDTLPLLANAKTIIGALGEVLSSAIRMDKTTPDRVRQYLSHGSSLYPLNPYLYYIDGNCIYHTATTASINVCVYERADIVSTVFLNGNINLPDVLVDALVAGAVAELIVESKGIEQASYFKNLFEAAIASIRQGQTTMPRFALAVTP